MRKITIRSSLLAPFSVLSFCMTCSLIVAVLGLSAPVFAASTSGSGPTVVPQQVVEQTVNINTASAEEISLTLKGVGLKKAQAIIEWRESNGDFSAVEQLLEVKGIGEKTLEMNKPYIQL